MQIKTYMIRANSSQTEDFNVLILNARSDKEALEEFKKKYPYLIMFGIYTIHDTLRI